MPPPPEIVWPLHVGATCAMAAVLWVVQLAIYTLFSDVGAMEFPAYHRRYVSRITCVVLPLMTLEAITGAWLLIGGLRAGPFVVALGLLGLVWLSTFAWQVPLHHQLAKNGFSPEVHRRLVATNWVRTLAWSLRVGLLLCFA